MTLIEILEARKEALDVHEMAELLRVSERHIYELVADGSLPAFRVGKVIRFDPQDVADWLRKKKPSKEQPILRRPPEGNSPGRNRLRDEGRSAIHIWRKRVNCLKAALATEGSSSSSKLPND